MSANQEDQTNLIALVALLISTAGFKEELASIKLGNLSLLTVFELASIAFGALLYLHLLLNAHLLLVQAWREKRRSKLLILLRLLLVAMLYFVPLWVSYIALSDWLHQGLCIIPPEFSFDPFVASTNVSSMTCPSILEGTVLPIILTALTVIFIQWLVVRNDKKLRNLPPELKNIKYQIQEYKIMQAFSSDPKL